MKPGTVLGHEAVGEVMEAGRDVHHVCPGDQVIVSSALARGHCRDCRYTMLGQCRGGGGRLLGALVNGTQAELVRVPFADHSTHRRQGNVAVDDAILLSEAVPTAYEAGVRDGHVRPGDTVVVVGAGPVGLAWVIVAHLYSPRRVMVVDLSAARLEAAARMGGDAAESPGKTVADLSEGPGADLVIEASGEPDGFVLGTRAVRTRGAHRRHRYARQAGHAASRVPAAQERDARHGPAGRPVHPWLLERVRYGDPSHTDPPREP